MHLRKKTCVVCGSEYQPTGRYSKFCSPKCRETHGKEQWKLNPRYKGCGSGNAQGFGEEHHSYTTGIGIFRRFLKSKCERCDSVKHLCVHHKDRDRHNNVDANLETLCKRCHQLEHKCIDNLPKGKALSEHCKQVAVSQLRDAKGVFVKRNRTAAPTTKERT